MQNSLSTAQQLQVPAFHTDGAAENPLENVSTDWDDVMDFVEASGGPERSGFNDWLSRNSRNRADWNYWLPRYKNFRHEFLYQVTPSLVKAYISWASSPANRVDQHALGTVRPREQQKVIRDLSPTPPLIFSFHVLLEHMKTIPSFTQFWRFHLRRRSYFMGQALLASGYYNRDPSASEWNTDPNLRTVRYRIGNAYYSALKEINILSTLRHVHGLDVRYHFIIDLEWKADLYIDNTLIEIYVSNERMKGNGGGRKITCQERNPGRSVLAIEKDAKGKFGDCYLHSPSEIADIARHIEASANRH